MYFPVSNVTVKLKVLHRKLSNTIGVYISLHHHLIRWSWPSSKWLLGKIWGRLTGSVHKHMMAGPQPPIALPGWRAMKQRSAPWVGTVKSTAIFFSFYLYRLIRLLELWVIFCSFFLSPCHFLYYCNTWWKINDNNNNASRWLTKKNMKEIEKTKRQNQTSTIFSQWINEKQSRYFGKDHC